MGGALMDDVRYPVVELRQYRLHLGKREVLIDLFDREFVETQEAVGIKVIGQFRDLDDPNRFVWLRGFDDMPSRAQALGAFYGGPVWKTHRDAANATMVDSDNVLLLHPARQASGFSLENMNRLPPNSREIPRGLFVATIYYLDTPSEDDFADFFDHTFKPVLMKAGAEILACFVTEDSPNTFTALPVREGEQVFIWFARFQDLTAYELHVAALYRSQRWRGEISDGLAHRTKRSPEVLKL